MKELVERDVQRTEFMDPKAKKQKRMGRTEITSVSISEEFRNIISKHKLSPTEVFRRGLAVTLADLGVHPFNNSLNKKRLAEIESYFELEKFIKLADEMQIMSYNLKTALKKFDK